MVYYGEWIQGDDYTRSPSYLWGRVQAPYGEITTDTAGDGVAPYDDEMNEALDATGTGGLTGAGGIGATLEVTGFSAYPTSVTVSTRISHGGGLWDATGLLDLAYYAAILEPTKPADAYGVEYESTPITPVAANLHLEIAGGGRDSTLPAGAPATDIGSSLSLSIKAGRTYETATSSIADLRVTPGMAPEPFDFDLTWAMGPQGECAIATTGTKDGPWYYSNPNDPGLISASAAGTQNTQMVYTLRPPRHRWLYDTSLGLPPLRQSPRDDNLGTASAARIWPPSSSRQGGLRRLGGIDC